MRAIVALVVSFLLSACMSTRVVFDERWNPKAKPDYVDYFDGFILGFSGDTVYSLQQICMDQKPLAAETVRSPEDIALSALTLGIYWPTTAKVWCGD